MKLTHIEITNYLGIAALALDLSKHTAHVFGGANNSGKSTISDAVRLALTGDSLRVELKKDYAKLLLDPKQRGSVALTFRIDDSDNVHRAVVHLPEGKRTITLDPDDAYTARLRCVLDAQRFARLDDKEKRRLLFDVMGVSFAIPAICAKLAERGIASGRLEAVKPMLRLGFDGASAEAATMAREKKAAWKAVTGEQWGSEKGAEWKAPDVNYDDEGHGRQMAAHRVAESELNAAQRDLGALKAKAQGAESNAAAITESERIAALHGERTVALEAAKAAATSARERAAKLEADLLEANKGVDGTALACPCCKAKLLMVDGVLHDAAKMKTKAGKEALAKLRADVAGAQGDRKRTAETELRCASDVRESEAAQARIATLKQAAKDAPDAEAIATAEARVKTATEKRDGLNDVLRSYEAQKQATIHRAEKNEKAALLHTEIGEWIAVAEALAPTGLPAELLGAALNPLNQRLDESASWANWPTVRIDEHMAITFGGRAYGLLSESEKWRADTMIADAIATLSGLRLLILDRVDVLDQINRMKFMAWLGCVTEDYDTILAFATLAKRPTISGAAVHWIEEGKLIIEPVAQAA
jgi:hypothetical protein